jgi:hypothetical protein
MLRLQNKCLDEGWFVNGVRSFRVRWVDSNWDQTHTGLYENGQMHGFGVFKWLASGREYTGEFKRGNKCGYGECKYDDGKIYKGEWKNGRWNGQGTLICPDGK